MSEIVVDAQKIADVIAGLRSLQGMSAEYESFSVSFGQSRGPQADALGEAALGVQKLAQQQYALFEQIIRGIVSDMEALGAVDSALARALLADGSQTS